MKQCVFKGKINNSVWPGPFCGLRSGGRWSWETHGTPVQMAQEVAPEGRRLNKRQSGHLVRALTDD